MMTGRPSRKPQDAASGGLRKVADIAGVSTATVSRALNQPHMVSAELRGRIEAIVKTLNWVPSGAARALARRKTETIGAIFPQMAQSDFASAIDALQDELEQHGYTLLLASSGYDIDREFQQVRKFVERGVDALLLTGELHHHLLEGFLQQNNVPLLNMFVYRPETHGTSVGPDNRKALYRLTQYLLRLGHTRFGVLAQDGTRNDRARARVEGIRQALAEQGLGIRPEHYTTGLYSIRDGRRMFSEVIQHTPRPTAVICGNAHLAVGAMLESQARGIKVPQEMSIACYDDIELMEHLPTSITTVRVRTEDVGRRAAHKIVALLEKRDEAVEFECDTEVVVRASSGPPPAEPAPRKRGKAIAEAVDPA